MLRPRHSDRHTNYHSHSSPMGMVCSDQGLRATSIQHITIRQLSSSPLRLHHKYKTVSLGVNGLGWVVQNKIFTILALRSIFTFKVHLHFWHRLTTSIADSRDYFSRSRSKVDDVSQRESLAKTELWTYARRHWRYFVADVSWYWTLNKMLMHFPFKLTIFGRS
jgi:hypothetical protein